MIVVEYNKKKYSSLRDLFNSEAVPGLTYACFYSRYVEKGWDLSDALTTAVHKPQCREYVVDNFTFDNLKDLAKAAGISYHAAIKRSHRGWSDKEIFYGRQDNVKKIAKKDRSQAAKKVAVNGELYESVQAAYDALTPSASMNAVKTRLHNGWSLEEALEVKERIDGRRARAGIRTLNIENEKMNAMEAAKKFSLPHSTVLDRLKRGATDRQAVGLDPIKEGEVLKQKRSAVNAKSRTPEQYFVDGKCYSSIKELAKAYNILPRLIKSRMLKNGWPLERAVKEPVSDCVVVEGITYRSAMNAWEKIGKTNFSTYNSRKSSGYSLKVCLGLEPLPEARGFEINGVKYESLVQVSKAFDITYDQLRYRLNLMSLEEAISYQPSNGRYSEGNIANNESHRDVTAILYFVKIKTKEGMLHKVGITKYSLEVRFRSIEYEPLSLFSGLLIDVTKIEKAVLKKFKDNLYRANEGFDGKTETFILTEREERSMGSFIYNLCIENRCTPIMKDENDIVPE